MLDYYGSEFNSNRKITHFVLCKQHPAPPNLADGPGLQQRDLLLEAGDDVGVCVAVHQVEVVVRLLRLPGAVILEQCEGVRLGSFQDGFDALAVHAGGVSAAAVFVAAVPVRELAGGAAVVVALALPADEQRGLLIVFPLMRLQALEIVAHRPGGNESYFLCHSKPTRTRFKIDSVSDRYMTGEMTENDTYDELQETLMAYIVGISHCTDGSDEDLALRGKLRKLHEQYDKCVVKTSRVIRNLTNIKRALKETCSELSSRVRKLSTRDLTDQELYEIRKKFTEATIIVILQYAVPFDDDIRERFIKCCTSSAIKESETAELIYLLHRDKMEGMKITWQIPKWYPKAHHHTIDDVCLVLGISFGNLRLIKRALQFTDKHYAVRCLSSAAKRTHDLSYLKFADNDALIHCIKKSVPELDPTNKPTERCSKQCTDYCATGFVDEFTEYIFSAVNHHYFMRMSSFNKNHRPVPFKIGVKPIKPYDTKVFNWLTSDGVLSGLNAMKITQIRSKFQRQFHFDVSVAHKIERASEQLYMVDNPYSPDPTVRCDAVTQPKKPKKLKIRRTAALSTSQSSEPKSPILEHKKPPSESLSTAATDRVIVGRCDWKECLRENKNIYEDDLMICSECNLGCRAKFHKKCGQNCVRNKSCADCPGIVQKITSIKNGEPHTIYSVSEQKNAPSEKVPPDLSQVVFEEKQVNADKDRGEKKEISLPLSIENKKAAFIPRAWDGISKKNASTISKAHKNKKSKPRRSIPLETFNITTVNVPNRASTQNNDRPLYDYKHSFLKKETQSVTFPVYDYKHSFLKNKTQSVAPPLIAKPSPYAQYLRPAPTLAPIKICGWCKRDVGKNALSEGVFICDACRDKKGGDRGRRNSF
jgi:hypothetical protein